LLKSGQLIQLKRGLYVTRSYIQRLGNNDAYLEFLSNNLKRPSYLSSEYVLQKYSMISESVFVYTNITTKKTKTYQNSLGTFQYANIKDELFCGFKITTVGINEIKQATKAKALFDYLYFRLWRIPMVSKEYVYSLRLNLQEMVREDFLEFRSYVDLAGIKKFQKLPEIIEQLTYDN